MCSVSEEDYGSGSGWGEEECGELGVLDSKAGLVWRGGELLLAGQGEPSRLTVTGRDRAGTAHSWTVRPAAATVVTRAGAAAHLASLHTLLRQQLSSTIYLE